LIKAIDRFDGGYGVALGTYAAPNILGEIKRHFRDRGWAMRVPRNVQELNVKLHKAIDRLTVKLGRSPRIDELGAATGSTKEQVLEALESSSAYTTISLSDRSAGEDDDGPDPLEAVGEDDDGYQRSEDRLTLRTVLRHLPARERQILHLRFFEGLTQSEIADRVGVSQMHVSRLIRDSLDRMRSELERSGRPGLR
jgi:RNA polymerase sigma-B factor